MNEMKIILRFLYLLHYGRKKESENRNSLYLMKDLLLHTMNGWQNIETNIDI